MPIDRRRRALVAGSAALAAAGLAPAFAATLTPPQTAGPFYPDQKPLDDDSDLTRVRGQAGVARGEITDLAGRVLDPNGRPIPGARVEIWQCDANGRYRHSHERGSADADASFQGFGHVVTGDDGGYRFRTIKPVPYPGRTPHIHYLVVVPGDGHLVTQLYIDGEPRNAADFLFNRLSEASRLAASAAFEPDPASGILKATFDIVLGLSNITPA
jgi:protocatechuate 3,4-dioxygenase beta subunit